MEEKKLADSHKEMMERFKQEDAESVHDVVQFLTFRVAEQDYGIDILETHEILKPVSITRLPNVSPDVMGVINLRGNIIPVIDLERKFSNTYASLDDDSRIIVSTNNVKFMGLLVRRVQEVARVREEDLEATSMAKISNEFIRGVGRSEHRIFLILNLEALQHLRPDAPIH